MDEDVAEAIAITNMCQEFHCLPREGGLLDQDSYLVWKMQIVMAAKAEKQARDQKQEQSRARQRTR
jgi:hypothetical protein